MQDWFRLATRYRLSVDRAWRFRLHASIEAEPDLVFAWFVDEERRVDRRRFFEKFRTEGFRWEERRAGDVYGVVAAWTTAKGTVIDLRITDLTDPGRRAQKLKVSQARIHLDGREDRAEAQSLFEFRPDGSHATRVDVSVDVRKYNYPWSEVSPLARRLDMRHHAQHLEEAADKCADAIGRGYRGSENP